jgi:hypothetical protein
MFAGVLSVAAISVAISSRENGKLLASILEHRRATVLASAHEHRVLFGDSLFAWKLSKDDAPVVVPSDFIESDAADVRFAVEEIEARFQMRLGPATSWRVFRGSRQGVKIYWLAHPSEREWFLLGFRK